MAEPKCYLVGQPILGFPELSPGAVYCDDAPAKARAIWGSVNDSGWEPSGWGAWADSYTEQRATVSTSVQTVMSNCTKIMIGEGTWYEKAVYAPLCGALALGSATVEATANVVEGAAAVGGAVLIGELSIAEVPGLVIDGLKDSGATIVRGINQMTEGRVFEGIHETTQGAVQVGLAIQGGVSSAKAVMNLGRRTLTVFKARRGPKLDVIPPGTIMMRPSGATGNRSGGGEMSETLEQIRATAAVRKQPVVVELPTRIVLRQGPQRIWEGVSETFGDLGRGGILLVGAAQARAEAVGRLFDIGVFDEPPRIVPRLVPTIAGRRVGESAAARSRRKIQVEVLRRPREPVPTAVPAPGATFTSRTALSRYLAETMAVEFHEADVAVRRRIRLSVRSVKIVAAQREDFRIRVKYVAEDRAITEEDWIIRPIVREGRPSVEFVRLTDVPK